MVEFRKILEDMKLKDISQIKLEMRVKFIGDMIDIAERLSDSEGTLSAISKAKKLLKEDLVYFDKARLNYFLGVAYADLYKMKYNEEDGKIIEDKKREELISKEIIHLRIALKEGVLEPEYSTMGLINLGIAYVKIGRYLEGLGYIKEAVEISPNYVMGVGNLGIYMIYFSNIFYDNSHNNIYKREGYKKLKKALTLNPEEMILGYRKKIEKMLGKLKNTYGEEYLENNKYDEYMINKPYKNVEDKKYRNWCYDNNLFLNPLTLILKEEGVMSDPLHLPSMIFKIGESLYIPEMYNLMKMEYISARKFLYEGLNEYSVDNPNSDDYIYEINNSLFSESIEKIKSSYRIAYSLLDKIAYFLNIYLDLGIEFRNVSFRKLWENKDNKKKLVERKNFYLNSLYWVYRELYRKKNDEFSECLDEESNELNIIRNFIEHKILRVYTSEFRKIQLSEPNDFCYEIEIMDLKSKTIKMLNLIRNSLIYLSFAVKIEEEKRKDEMEKLGLIVKAEKYRLKNFDSIL